MKLRFAVVTEDDVHHVFSFLDDSYSFIHLPNQFVINAFKVHNHSYYFKAFFYNTLAIYSLYYCNSKYKLYCAVLSVLKQELYDVRQY